MPKSFNRTLALQAGFLKHLGDVATALLNLVCLSLFCFFVWFQTDWMRIRSMCGVRAVVRQKSHKIFFTDTLQQKIKTTDLKRFLAVDNTSILIILATTVSKVKLIIERDTSLLVSMFIDAFVLKCILCLWCMVETTGPFSRTELCVCVCSSGGWCDSSRLLSMLWSVCQVLAGVHGDGMASCSWDKHQG